MLFSLYLDALEFDGGTLHALLVAKRLVSHCWKDLTVHRIVHQSENLYSLAIYERAAFAQLCKET